MRYKDLERVWKILTDLTQKELKILIMLKTHNADDFEKKIQK